MTRLFILRHAKAAPALPAMRDFDRPLAPSGIIASAALGVTLAQNGLVPNIIKCSPSHRTRQTLNEVSKHFQNSVTVTYEQKLYTEDWTGYLEIIKATSKQNLDTPDAFMIVGHNPSCEEIIHQLIGSGDKLALRRLVEGVAPGAMALIDFEVPLSQIEPRTGYLHSFLLDGCTHR